LEIASIILLAVAAYLIGCISPSYYLVRYIKHVDIRTVGSNNAGTLNTFRELGPWWALPVLLIDAGKGAIAVVLPALIGLPWWVVYITAVCVILGHNWPVLLKFRGGKGAASLIGICLAFVPLAGMVAAIPGVITIFLSKNGIAGLVAGFATLNILLLVAWVFNLNGLVPEASWRQPLLCLPLTLFVAAVYGVSIRGQLLEAVRQRSVRKALYGP